jgi:hypothetical protein
MDRHATIAQKQRMRRHGFHIHASAERDDVAAIDAFCKEHGLTRSSVLVRGALALCGIPLKAAEEMQHLRHVTREWDRHINGCLRMNAAGLARKVNRKRKPAKD